MIIDDKVDSRIKSTLADLGSDDQERVAKFLADKLGMPYIDLRIKSPELDALQSIPIKDVEKYNLAPFKLVKDYLHVAVRDPGNEATVEFLKDFNNYKKKLIIYVCSKASYEQILKRYRELATSEVKPKGIVNLSEEYFAELLKDVHTIKDFQTLVTDVAVNEKRERISKLIELTIAGALHFEVSDIHTEPEQDKIRIRYRIDGNLNDIYYTDKETYNLMNSRLKIVSGLKLTTTATAQDGRFSIKAGTEEIEVRVSLVPGAYGESYVMRLLDPRSASVPFEALGMSEIIMTQLERAINKPFGMVLTTGPTGSGKSTTLYSCLKKVYNPEIKIITIEDPIEYHFEGITQTQVDVKKDYTFLNGLRAALRQDPDVIMVGEIRDEDTARTAAQAALTGHIVLSTLHTNTAAGAVPRLVDLGVDPKTLGSALSLVMAQRLTRKLCPHCKIEVDSDEKESKMITNILGEMVAAEKVVKHRPANSYKIFMANPEGCDKCNLGYKGRIGIFEAIVMDKDIENVSVNSGGERDVAEVALKQKIPTLREDGVEKLLDGITSFDELSQVVDLY